VSAPPEKQREELVRSLQSAYGKGCFTRAKDYWTYEVCPFNKVRQYHKEGDRVTMEFNLGSYDPALDSPVSEPVYAQRYTGGSGKRQSTVRFLCNDDSPDPKPLLTGIAEPEPLRYEFEIKTALACDASRQRTGQARVESYLQPLAGQCVYLNTGWWTYKFCYGKSVSQFHRESRAVQTEPGKPPQQEVITTQEYDLGTVSDEPIAVVAGSSPKDSYASQWYAGGTPCDVGSKEPRKTEVRYVCDPNESLAIKAVKETATCEYQLIAATRLLCQHKQFAAEEPRVHEIACSPLLHQVAAATAAASSPHTHADISARDSGHPAGDPAVQIKS